jgi:hypothetical protein
MADTPNYKESTVTGSSWVRAYNVSINNPYGGLPSIEFKEQKVVQLDGEQIYKDCGTLRVDFNPANTDHLLLYDRLNELYIELREARDLALSLSQIPPGPEE